MGRGNVCTHGKYDGLYYVDYDLINMYSRELADGDWESITQREYYELGKEKKWEQAWELDDVLSSANLYELEANFCDVYIRRFKSFAPCGKWISRDRYAILENELFYIAIEDNEWSLAFELIGKEKPFTRSLDGVRKRYHQKYLDAIRDALFEFVDEVCIRNGPWMSHRFGREDIMA